MSRKRKARSDSVNMRPEEFELMSYGPKREARTALPDPVKKLRELRERHGLMPKGTK